MKLSEAVKVYAGSVEATKVMLGSEQVWTAEALPPAYGADFCTGGTASAESEYADWYVAAWAFDRNIGTHWGSKTCTTTWIKYDLGEGVSKTAAQYRLTARGISYHPCTAWLFQGSNNNADWTTIDSQSGQTWTDGEVKTFNGFSNSTAYRYYRLLITPADGLAELAEIEMMELE